MDKTKLIYASITIGVIFIITLIVATEIKQKSGNQNLPSGNTPTPAQLSTPTLIPPPSNPAYQGQADKNNGDEVKTIYDSYPWIDKFPLQTDLYFFYFDINKKAFIGKLYPQKSSGLSVDAQVASLKQEILDILQTYGIDSKKYPIDWTVTVK